MAAFDQIDFRDSIVGRQAYVRGSGLAVWEVAMLLRAHDDDAARVTDYLEWPSGHVEAAVRYIAAYPDEIDAALADNDSYDLERLRQIFPDIEVFTVPDEAGG